MEAVKRAILDHTINSLRHELLELRDGDPPVELPIHGDVPYTNVDRIATMAARCAVEMGAPIPLDQFVIAWRNRQ